jgi:hypothetical protein
MFKGMFDSELILPGVITEIINDYINGYDTSEFGTTDAVTIIGTAFNGPVGIPVPVFSPEYAKYMFGEAYNNVTRQEATLVPEIYDAWERGCRTIYAVRVSGKEMYKDFELAVESKLKLRLSGQFPCNANKECFMLYKANQGSTSAGKIRIYKPADRTTVQEKLQGVVNDLNSILVSEIDLTANGVSKSSKLTDLITLFNNFDNNNVLKMSIVDDKGITLTEADRAVQLLNVGDLFPGIYTICRDKVGEDINPKTNIDIVRSIDSKPYNALKHPFWKKLIINTDVKQPYPLFADDFQNFKTSLSGIAADFDYEFLRKVGLMDRLAVKNEIDYEEVVMDPFDLYCKLGKGFVKNAKIELKEKNGRQSYKVVLPEEDDPQRVVGINEGIYSILENHRSDYLVLAGISAETVISGQLPKKNEFQIINPGSVSLLDAEGGEVVLRANCKVQPKDVSMVKDYNMSIKNTEANPELEALLNEEFILNDLSEMKFIRMPVISEDELVNKFEGIEGDLLALAINTSDPNLGTKQGQLVRFNSDKKMFDLIDFDLLGIGIKGEPEYVAPKLLVQIADSLKVYKSTDKGGVYELDEQPTMFEDEDGNEVQNRFIIATNGANANVYYVPLDGKDSILQSVNILRDIDANILTDDDNDNDIYDEGVDHILACKLDSRSIVPMLSLRDLAEGKLNENDFTVACLEKDIPKLPASGISENETFVAIFSNEISFCSQEEMVNTLNKIEGLNDKFVFEITDSANALEELPDELNGSALSRDEELIYDINMYIPYTTTDNFARHLAQHCLYTQLKTYPTHGVIGCSKLIGINLSTIAQRVDEICNFEFDLFAKKDNGNYMLDSDNQPYPLGRCLSITFLQYRTGTGSEYAYVSNGAAGYAGMVSALPIERSSTNQPFDIDEMVFELSNYQLGRLNTKGIVCAKNTTNLGIVIVDGITQAPKTSSYRRLSTSKTINAVDKVLRNAIEPYIGLVDSLTTRNSLNTAIKSALDTLKGIIINDFKFKIYADESGGNLGVIRVDYVIVPFNEIREVRNRVEISDAI